MIQAMSTPTISMRAARGDLIRGSRVGTSYSGGLGESAAATGQSGHAEPAHDMGSDPAVGQRRVDVAGLREMAGPKVGLRRRVALTGLLTIEPHASTTTECPQ